MPGVGNGGGFKLQLQDLESDDMRRVLGVAYQVMGMAQQNPDVTGVFTTFSANGRQIYLDIDRVRAQILNVPIGNIFETLSVNLGSTYVNDFNSFGRLFQVRAQADERFRVDAESIPKLKVRSATGALVPLGTLVTIRDATGPQLVQRYNMLVSVPLQGNAAPGKSTGQALDAMEAMVAQAAPPGVTFEWTDLALQERSQGNTSLYIFGLSILFAFLVLAALYESWALPFAIVMIVPLSILAALIGVSLRGMDNNILTQIGLIVLVGLAAKNAILIVEFAKQAEVERGLNPVEAAVDASRQPAPDPDDGLRLHPGRGAAGDRHGLGRRDAAGPGHGRVFGDDRRDLLRAAADAGLLRGDPAPAGRHDEAYGAGVVTGCGAGGGGTG